ncbi:MAG TPA: hypothetical protein VF646_19225 [Cytophagales bacterium]|jgi:type IV secretory pathway VirB10-like protein
MKKNIPAALLSVRMIGLIAFVCLWTACTAPRQAQLRSASPGPETALAAAEEAPQAAQGNPDAAPAQPADEPALLASNEPATVASANPTLDEALRTLSAEQPKMARKLGSAARQANATHGKAASPEALNKVKKSLGKVLAKAEKKFDAKKAQSEKAAQAQTGLVALGALLAVGGLVLALVTSGTAATVGWVLLGIGLIVLLISVLSA